MAKEKRGWLLRALTPSQLHRFLLEDAKDLGANEAGGGGEEVRGDADKTVSELLFLCPGAAATGWGGAEKGRFRNGQWPGPPYAVLLTNTGYPGCAGKVQAGCMSDLVSTWEF